MVEDSGQAGQAEAAIPLAEADHLEAGSPKSSAFRRVVIPALFAILIGGALEGFIAIKFEPDFWQKSTWLMHDPYHGGEIFDRLELYLRLSHLDQTDPDIISVGDSSGFFSLQSTIINRYLGGVKFLSLNTGANQAFDGYLGIAEYMLQRSPKIKYVVLYMFPQLLPEEEVIRVADLGPITYDDLVSPNAILTPPSAFLSPYLKGLLFEGQRYHAGDPVTHSVPNLQLLKTVDAALGWLPEFDVRFDRLNGRVPFYPDSRSGWYNHLGITDSSAINANLDAFDKAVRSYGAQLVIAFGPTADRSIFPNDPLVAVADQALARFQREHPDVKFLFPLITRWGSEKFGMFNHISREFTFLSSERLGKALQRLVQDPDSIPPYTAEATVSTGYPEVKIKETGPTDPELLTPSLALYLYTSTADPKYENLFSKRVANLLTNEPAFQYAMADAKKRVASLADQKITIGFDLSQMHATPVEIQGLSFCGDEAGVTRQWVQLQGTMIFTYKSQTEDSKEPVVWPISGHVLVPTIVEDGVRKYDGFCPEPSMSN